jgi:hypothetical protein
VCLRLSVKNTLGRQLLLHGIHRSAQDTLRMRALSFVASRLNARLKCALFVLIALLVSAVQAFAATCAPATSQGPDGPPSWQSYCWIDMSSYNATQVFGGGQPFSITLSDGSTVTFTLSGTTTNSGTLGAVASPSWGTPTTSPGAAFGRNAFLGIPGLPVLYTTTSGSNVTLTFSNIQVTPPAGVVYSGQFKFVVADGESTNGTERLIYTTNGGGWTIEDTVANGTGTNYPGSTGAGTSTYTNTGVNSPAGAYIVGTQSPTTVTAQLISGGLQGIIFAIQFSTITVNKVISGTRANAADQFTYGVYATNTGATVLQGTSTGTGSGPFNPTVATLSSGVSVTLRETMAAGSVSNLNQYTTNLNCTNTNTGSPTVLPSNQAVTSFNVGSSSYGDAIACTFTNTAKPARVAIQKQTSGAIGGAFTFTATNLASVPASVTTTATNTPTPASPTFINATALNTAVTITETPATNFSISAVSCTDANATVTGNTGTFGTFAGNVVTIPAARVVAAADITCVITNSLSAATPTVVVQKTTIGAAGGVFTFTATNLRSNPAGITTLSTGTAYPLTQVPIAVTTTGTAVTITETAATNFTINTASCIDTNFSASGNSSSAFGTLSGSVLTIPNTNVRAQARIVCTFNNIVNPAIPTVAVQKITTGAFGGPFTFAATNLTGTVPSITTTAIGTAAPTTTIPVTVSTTATAVTITETVNSNFNFTTASCVDTNAATSGNPTSAFGTLSGTQITIATTNLRAFAKIVCTFTNAAKLPTVAVKKITLNAFGGPFTFTQTGLASTPAAITTTVAGTATPATPTAIAATAVNAAVQITEAANPRFTTTSASCTDLNATFTGNPASFGSLAGNVLTIPAANMLSGAQIECTFTNTAVPASVRIQKTTTGGFGGPFNFAVNNLASAPAAISTTAVSTAAPASPTAIAVSTLNSLVQISETSNPAYTFTTATCTDSNSAVTGNPATFGGLTGLLLTIPAANVLPAAQITCTFTNAAIPATFSIQKQTISTAGGPFNFTATNLASTPAAITTTAAATATPAVPTAINISTLNTAVTVTENPLAFTLTAISCTDTNASVSGNPASFGSFSGSVLTVPAANVVSAARIRCVLTNTPTPATMTIRKVTTGAFGGPFTFTQTNLASVPPNLSTTAIGAAGAANSPAITVSALGTAVQVTEGANTSFTLATVTCSDTNSSVSGNPASFGTLAGSTITIPAGNVLPAANILCVFTNAARAPTITLTKSLTSRIAPADQFTITSSSGQTATSTGATTGTVATFNITGTAGTAYTLNESMAAGSTSVLGQYAQTVSCTNTLTTGTAVSGLTTLPISFTAAGGDIISCTITNAPRPTTLQLSKAWGPNNIATDVASIGVTTGGASNTVAFTANAGVAANSGTPVTIAVGNTIGLPAETFSTGNIANYNTALACTTNLGATANTVSSTNGQNANTLVIGAGDTGKTVICTYTNTRKSTILRLNKTWDAASINGDVANFVPTTGLINNTTAFSSTSPTSASGGGITVYAGEQATLPAETMSVGTLANYLTPLTCNAGTLVGTNGQSTGNTLTITAAATATNPIICTYANTRVNASLTISKTAGFTPTPVVLNQVITYTYKISNNGNVPVSNVSVNDMHGTPPVQVPLGAGGITAETLSIPGPGGIAASPDTTPNDGIWSTLAPGAEVTFTYTHTVTQAEIDNG